MQESCIAETSMGAQSPHTLKKRASPPPLLDQHEGSPEKRPRKVDAVGKENISRSAAVEPFHDVAIKPPECGVITRIECENFMCHRKFTVDLCRNVNFIYGQNGSGKSAILAAIQICLGAGARRTHRARNLKDLVRKDSDSGYAKVRVTLLNKGDDAYKHELYGDKITVERTIATRGGYNGTKLFDAQGKEVSRSRKDLDELLDKVNAQVENPVAILDQEEAKKFLTGKSEDKYAFFMKATELERIDRNIAATVDKIAELEDQEKRMERTLENDIALMDQTKKQYEQHKEIEKMKRKLHACEEALAWSMYKEANALLQDELNRVQQFREKAERRKEELTQAEAATQDGDTEELNLRNKVEELTKEADDQANKKRDLEQEYKRAREPLKAMERNLQHLQREKTTMDRMLQSTKQKLETKRQEILARAGSAESEAAKRTQRLKDAQDELASLKEKYDQAKQNTNDSRQAWDELEPFVKQAHTNVEDTTKKLRAIESHITSLKSASGSSLAIFGQRCAQLKNAVDDFVRKGQFRGQVCGPIGAYLKVVPGKEHYAALAECAMGNGVLDRFVVTNDHDRKVLQQLRQRIGCQSDCGIFQVAMHSGRFEVPGPPVEGIETVESVLNISDNLVFNCLVDHCKIEERALARTREESEQKLLMEEGGKLSIRGKIKNVYFLPRGDSWSVKGTSKTLVSNDKEKLRESIGVDRSKALEEASREAENTKHELSILRREESKLEHEHREKQIEWNKAKREMQSLQDSMNRIVEQIDSIKSEQDTAETFDTDTSDLEQDVENAQNELDSIKAREGALKEEIAMKIPQVEEIKSRVDETTARNAKVLRELQAASEELTAYMSTLSQRDEKLEKKRNKLKQLQEIVAIQEEKINEITADVNKYLRHSRLLAYHRMKREEADNEGIDGEQTSQFSQDPADDELEAIEINDVDKDSRYYRAKIEKLAKKIDQEKERRKANKEDALAALEKYKRAKEIVEGKMAQLEEITNVKENLTQDVLRRKQRWELFRQHIANKTSLIFDEVLNKKGSSGTVEFDHESGTLELVVQKDSADANSQQKDAKALSGGERSYATIALLIALGESLETPFRILDEFDVFLDPVTRKMTIQALIEMAKGMAHRQFVFITPQDVSSVTTDPMLKVLKMTPPARTTIAGGPSQQTLDFSQS